AQFPDRVAVTLDDEQLTYRELSERANRLARHLQARGVRPGDLVGLCMERTPQLVVGLLAILKAGGAYVPLDPSYPGDRLAFMIEDSGIGVLVTERLLAASLPPHAATVCCVDEERDTIA